MSFLAIILGLLTITSRLVLSQKIVVRMGESGNPIWYLAIYIDNNGCNTLEKVEIKDGSNYPNWYLFTDRDPPTGDEFKFNNNGNSFTLPISVRITNSNGEQITKIGLITNWNEGQTFNTQLQFCDGSVTAPPSDPPTPEPTTRPTPPTVPQPTYSGSSCIPITNAANDLIWESKNNQLYLNGVRFNMKGLSWFGFETDTYIPHGIPSWSGSLSYLDILDWMVDHDFNAIRLPFSWNGVNNNPVIPASQYGGSVNTQAFSGKRLLQAMDIIIDAAGDRGILIMLDMHSVNVNSFTDGFDQLGGNPSQKALQIWRLLAQRYKNRYNIFMADLYNEPHDISNGNWQQWINFVNQVSNALIDEGVNWLFAVQGTNPNCQGLCGRNTNCNWGENIVQLDNRNGCAGIRPSLTQPSRIVYTPHTYGPSFAGNLMTANGWEQRWGFAAQVTDAAIILGEYGTRTEFTWLNDLVDYLISIDQRNTFYWCFNQNSGDTGGLIASWNLNDEETAKLDVLKRLQPNPTNIVKNGNQICIDGQTSPTPPPTDPPSPPPAAAPTTKAPTPAPTYSLSECPTTNRRRVLDLISPEEDNNINSRKLLNSGNGISFGNLNIQNWWLQFEVLFPPGCSRQLKNAYITDNVNYQTPYQNTGGWGCCAFQFQHNGMFTYPLTVTLVDNNDNEVVIQNAFTQGYSGSDPPVETDASFCNNPSPTPPPASTPTVQPTRNGYSITFDVTLNLQNGNSLPSNSLLKQYAEEVTQALLGLDNSYPIQVNIQTKTNTKLVFRITVTADRNQCKLAIDNFVNNSGTFNADFAEQFDNKLGNSPVVVTSNAGIEVLYNKDTDNGTSSNDAFWKKVTNILLVIILSLIGLLCLITIAFCVFCRVHSKKMRQRIRQSVARRFSTQPTKTRQNSHSNNSNNENPNVAMTQTQTSTQLTQAIVAETDE